MNVENNNISNREVNLDVTTTPYSRSDEQLIDLISKLERTEVIIDKDSNPEIGNQIIYRVNSSSPKADIGRTLEANIFTKDYGYTREFIEEHFELYDQNSFFFLLVDKNEQDEATLVGALRVIDCSHGKASETQSMFKEFYGEDTPLPNELQTENYKAAWDIFTVVVDRKYRDGLSSVWLYHALYKSSHDDGVKRWLSNITPAEIKNLRDRIGIPFEKVPGIESVVDITPNGKKAEYGFYYLDVDEIDSRVSARIGNMREVIDNSSSSERDKKISELLTYIAKIALNGSSQ